MARTTLLACGIFASLLYVATDVLGAVAYEGYSYVTQAVSELSALGAPTRPLVAPLFLAHSLLQFAFGVGVWMSAGRRRNLRITAGTLIAIGLIDLVVAPFFPMHARGAEATLTDTMHIVVTGVTVLLILMAVGFGASAHGRRFRLYSIATLIALVAGGTVAALNGARLAANLPTPWLGMTERINIYAYLLWMLVLALMLLRARTDIETNRRHNASIAA